MFWESIIKHLPQHGMVIWAAQSKAFLFPMRQPCYITERNANKECNSCSLSLKLHSTGSQSWPPGELRTSMRTVKCAVTSCCLHYGTVREARPRPSHCIWMCVGCMQQECNVTRGSSSLLHSSNRENVGQAITRQAELQKLKHILKVVSTLISKM